MSLSASVSATEDRRDCSGLQQVQGPEMMEGTPGRRHCWECLRRRLVCDGMRPACTRCRSAGIVCPGFEDKQPLRWLQPGKVTARTRKPKKAKPGGGSQQPQPYQGKQQQQEEEEGGEGSTGNDSTLIKTTKTKRGIVTGTADDYIWAVAQAVQRYGKGLSEPLDTVSLDILRFDVKVDDYRAAEAARFSTLLSPLPWHIVSVSVYEQMSPLSKLLPRDKYLSLPWHLYHRLPYSLKFCYISIGLCVAAHRLPEGTSPSELALASSRIWQYRGQGLRALNQEISSTKTRASDGTISSIVSLAVADIQFGFVRPNSWRHHLYGVAQLISLRGGMKKLLRESPFMRLPVITLIIFEVIGNTTTPFHDQAATTSYSTSSLDSLDFIRDVYADGIFPFYIGTLLPPPLLLGLIRINRLRAQAASSSSRIITTTPTDAASGSAEEPDPNKLPAAAEDEEEARALLAELEAFDPSTWSVRHRAPGTDPLWDMLGRIYQSAAVLYCITSLQSVSVLPPQTHHPALAAARAAHLARLLADLGVALRSPELISPCFWPLVVAGQSAAFGTDGDRAFVLRELEGVRRTAGTSLATVLRGLFVEFWASGRTGWDDCFGEAYLFVV
ncbi:fungal-specific transcription factor domain-containing protein [Xylariomycetidae sp. FL2044]|nr:fungal-specific transcription factor domain-containing protein [Xylariomycetidae sp. FL2044]